LKNIIANFIICWTLNVDKFWYMLLMPPKF
jgi:hypothetical protein